jgi:hypothetical protein
MTVRSLNVDALYRAVDDHRRTRRLSWAAVGRETHIDRIEARLDGRRTLSADIFLRLLAFIGEPDVRRFTTPPSGDIPPTGHRPVRGRGF